YMKRRLRSTKHNLKVFSVLTDFNTHRMSISKNVDAIFIAQEEEKKKLEKKYPGCKFYAFGIATKSVWDDEIEHQKCRERLSIPEDKRVIVISGGGEGLLSREVIFPLLKRDST
ncbi:hypothetical protein, partial [Pseudomonas sp. 2995-3]|uniref:MGDG synthase family glycosyltransferase n=1 Tax=Pseudomonas sp. 2995-3 TaxID=1712680 RepID=UPI001C46BE58